MYIYRGDHNFHYDFNAERILTEWTVKRGAEGVFQLTAEIELAAATSLHVFPCPLFANFAVPNGAELIDFTIGESTYALNWTPSAMDWTNSAIAYIAEGGGLRYGFNLQLSGGKHALCLRLRGEIKDPAKGIRLAIVPEPQVVPPRKSEKFISAPQVKELYKPCVAQEPIPKGFNPGIGTEPSAGRFGFTKGDGVLDCAMPVLGVIDKLYLCGHPKYLKPYKWTVSLLPPGIDPGKRYHGSYHPAQLGLENDAISVNHLCVNWKTSFNATDDFFERRAGSKVDFACSYSLGTAGLLVESSDPGISLSMLEYAGNYQYLLLPQAGGVSAIALSEGLHRVTEMTENWVLLLGASEFPDLPILFVFDKAPAEFIVRRTATGRLCSLDFHIPPKDAKAIIATPFGIESRQPGSPDDMAFIEDAIGRCRFWSRALLAYPIKCREYFRLDEDAEKVEIVQRFDYRIIKDQWGTEPLKTAPLPPPLSILDGSGIVEFGPGVQDFKFPTKYGFLKGRAGADSASYKIPYMPRERRFPLKDIRDQKLAALLGEDLKEYLDFHEQFKDTWQAYPYAGAAMEPYAWAAPLFNFMDAGSWSRLALKASQRLAHACDQDRQYEYPVIDWGKLMQEMPGAQKVVELYRDPALRKMKLYNWYGRKEPFTGIEYRVCYLNIGLFFSNVIKEGTREEVANLKNPPLIENDWGAGLAFYYMYLCAMISGDFGPLRENWRTVADSFDYFEKLHDWACMGTALSDNGIMWVEGANYGAFTSYVNMAEAIGNRKSYEKGVYLAAKQLALRLAIFRSSQSYFYRFYDCEPWYITKCFYEEVTGYLDEFQNVPTLWKGYRFEGIYNLTTEGLFPELFSALNRFFPEDFAIVRKLALQFYGEAPAERYSRWGSVQESSSCLMAAALDESYDEARLLGELELVESRDQLIKEWRGVHIYSRLLPKNYFKCQILVLLENRKHPAWLEHWVNLEIFNAVYDRESRKASVEFKLHGERGVARFGVRQKPLKSCLNGVAFEALSLKAGKMEFELFSSGRLELFF